MKFPPPLSPLTCFTHLSRLTRLPALPRLPGPRLSSALLGATALELFVLTGRLIVYPFGLTPERDGTAPAEAGPPAATDPPTTTTTTALPVMAATTPPVVLLHGFIDNRSAFVVLRRTLTRHGRRLASLNYSPLTRDVRTAAELLGRHVEEICARTGHGRVDIVGHSLGGLIARYYVQRLGGDRRVRTLVTLGTPHGAPPSPPGRAFTPSCGRCAAAPR